MSSAMASIVSLVSLATTVNSPSFRVTNGTAEPGTIVQEMQPGYMIKDRLLRPAMVKVAKA